MSLIKAWSPELDPLYASSARTLPHTQFDTVVDHACCWSLLLLAPSTSAYAPINRSLTPSLVLRFEGTACPFGTTVSHSSPHELTHSAIAVIETISIFFIIGEFLFSIYCERSEFKA